MRRRNRRRGAAMVEFALAGIGSCFVLICTFQLAMAMWNYHTLAYAVHEASRYAAVKGVDCTKPGNTCSATIADIAHKIASQGIGLPAGAVNVTLTTDSGAATSCNPLNSCYSNATVWPPAANNDNAVGKKITVTAHCTFAGTLFFWPGAGKVRIGAVSFPASSTQTILF